jgi:hypothetical protein
VDSAGVDSAGVDSAGVDSAGVDSAGVDSAGALELGELTEYEGKVKGWLLVSTDEGPVAEAEGVLTA